MRRKRLILGLALVFAGLIGISVLTIPSIQPRIGIDRASVIAESYLSSLENSDLAIGEIMEFEQNFYVIYYEKSTDLGAFEMLIDKSTGRIFPEYGPNMMWNTKYGHGGMMGGWNPPPSDRITFSQDVAVFIAQEFLDTHYIGTIAEDPHPFYGYYTIHVEKDGKIYGMLSVKSNSGEVWYHNWHGAYIQTLEIHQKEAT